MISGLSLVYGVGVNDADYQLSKSEKINGKYIKVWKCTFYQTWVSMIERGYSKRFKEKYPTYLNVTVCDDWLTFSRFRSWMICQDWEGNHLDKDLVGNGLVYSPENCCFVPGFVNTSLVMSDSNRGDLPVGVSRCVDHRANPKFLAMVKDRRSRKGVYQKNLGRYSSSQEAHLAWQLAKVAIFEEVFNDYKKESCYIERVGNSILKVIEKIHLDISSKTETKSFKILGE